MKAEILELFDIMIARWRESERTAVSDQTAPIRSARRDFETLRLQVQLEIDRVTTTQEVKCQHEHLAKGVFKAKCKDCGAVLVRESLAKSTDNRADDSHDGQNKSGE